LEAAGDNLFFVARDGVHGRELWKSDGTAAGTVMVKNIFPGDEPSDPRGITAVGATVFFAAAHPDHGTELWRSDGTATGTRLVKDIYLGEQSSAPRHVAQVGGTVYFSAKDRIHGRELWKSDGTEEGTMMVMDIAPGASSSISFPPKPDLTESAGTTYFVADDGTHGPELWKTDGTSDGTSMVADVHPGNLFAMSPRSLTDVAGTLYFVHTDATHGEELWRSNGTEGGTVLVKDFAPGEEWSKPDWLTNFQGTLYLGAYASQQTGYGWEPWRSDGTEQGTVLIKDIKTGSWSSGARAFTPLGDILLFSATDGETPSTGHGMELWRTDGTSDGTDLVKDICPGTHRADGDPYPNESRPGLLVAVGDTMYFSAHDGRDGYSGCTRDGHGRELWRTGGTADTTALVRDIKPGQGSSDPAELTPVGGTLFFTARDGWRGGELWKVVTP
jgi:ELWxxDGT repeat protein